MPAAAQDSAAEAAEQALEPGSAAEAEDRVPAAARDSAAGAEVQARARGSAAGRSEPAPGLEADWEQEHSAPEQAQARGDHPVPRSKMTLTDRADSVPELAAGEAEQAQGETAAAVDRLEVPGLPRLAARLRPAGNRRPKKSFRDRSGCRLHQTGTLRSARSSARRRAR